MWSESEGSTTVISELGDTGGLRQEMIIVKKFRIIEKTFYLYYQGFSVFIIS